MLALATSNASVIPEGGVSRALLANACDVMIISFAARVVTLGAVCVRPLGVFCPACTSTGFVVATPKKV